MGQNPGGKLFFFSRTMTRIFRTFWVQEKNIATACAYINPWHAAMDKFMNFSNMESARAKKRRKKRKVEKTVASRPMLRL